tara:strand:+ start:96 stop:1046 length:951 start_codon:yes stop_codon:yes gene_type:complete
MQGGTRARQRRSFEVDLPAGSIATLEIPPGVAAVLSQASLAEPRQRGTVQLFCNGVLLCSLSRDAPDARLPLTPISAPSYECVGPEGSSVHVCGYTFALAGHGPLAEEEEEEEEEENEGETDDEEVGLSLPTEAEHVEILRGRKRRLAELQIEAAADAERPPSASRRVARLTFNPEVLAAEYSPKHSGISPVREKLSLESMVAHREEIKAAQALECAEAADEEDEEEGVQQVLALLVTSSVPKLRELCEENGLETHGAKSELIERLIDYVSLDMREERAERWRAESKRSLPADEEEEEEVGDFVGPPMPPSMSVSA